MKKEDSESETEQKQRSNLRNQRKQWQLIQNHIVNDRMKRQN